MPSLLLFDIDGTLVRVPAGRQALRAAFLELFGAAQVVDEFDFSGQTDQAAFRELAARSGCPAIKPETIINRYLDHLTRELAVEPGRLLPGASEIVRRCHGDGDFRLALGTGNVEAAARAKLAAHDLSHFFPVGGFGDDAVDRPDILLAGLQKAEDYYGQNFSTVIVIGDSPADIVAARAIGAKVLAVASGRPTAQQLARQRPDALLPALAPTNQALQTLRRLSDPQPTT